MPLAGNRRGQGTPCAALSEAAGAIAEAAVTRALLDIRQEGLRAANASDALGEAVPDVLSASLALVVRDTLIERFDAVALRLTNDGYNAAVRAGASRTEAWKRIGSPAGRGESAARFAFGRPRSLAAGGGVPR